MKDLHPLVKVLFFGLIGALCLDAACHDRMGSDQCRRVCAPNGVATYSDVTGFCTCQSAKP